MKRTTDLKAVLEGEPFTWGEVLQSWVVGPYAVVEYHPWKADGCLVLTGKPNRRVRMFHGWAGGRDTSHSWASLEAALAGVMAYYMDGPNSPAGEMFMRMLLLED